MAILAGFTCVPSSRERTRCVTRKVKRWRNGKMALRWVAADMIEAANGFRRLMARKHLPIPPAALLAHQERLTEKPVAPVSRPAQPSTRQRRSPKFDKLRDITNGRLWDPVRDRHLH
jgi:hypothetical protein